MSKSSEILFCGNACHGIRAELSGGEASIRDNEIYDNGESGIAIRNSYGEILGNVIYDNDDNGIVIEQATFSITGNTVARNALSGIKLIAEGGAFTEHIARNIVAMNRGSGINGDGGIAADITCNDVWANSPGGVLNYGGSISDRTGLNGNISVDPYFCNVYTNSFAPAMNSPVFNSPVVSWGRFRSRDVWCIHRATPTHGVQSKPSINRRRAGGSGGYDENPLASGGKRNIPKAETHYA